MVGSRFKFLTLTALSYNCTQIPPLNAVTRRCKLTSLIKGTILDSPFLVCEGRAMIGRPRASLHNDAPRMKSICPPKPKNHKHLASLTLLYKLQSVAPKSDTGWAQEIDSDLEKSQTKQVYKTPTVSRHQIKAVRLGKNILLM